MDEIFLGIILYTVLAFIVGSIIGWVWCANIGRNKLSEVKKQAKEILDQANQKAKTIYKTANLKVKKISNIEKI